jgi:hypothetical protein
MMPIAPAAPEGTTVRPSRNDFQPVISLIFFSFGYCSWKRSSTGSSQAILNSIISGHSCGGPQRLGHFASKPPREE